MGGVLLAAEDGFPGARLWIFALPAIGFVVTALVFLLWLRRYRGRLDALRHSLGFRNKGSGRIVRVIEGTLEGRPYIIGLSTHGGPDGRDRRDMEMSTPLGAWKDLTLCIGRAGAKHAVLRALGHRGVQVEDADFNRSFAVWSPDPDGARRCLDGDARRAVRAFCEADPRAILLLGGGRLRDLVKLKSLEVPAGEVRSRLRRLGSVAEALERAGEGRPARP